MEGGQIIKKTDSSLEKEYSTSYRDILSYYEGAFKKDQDVSSRSYGNVTYIADLGRQPWDSIEISVIDKDRTKVVISKNSLVWALKNLVFPFAGVFVVLIVLYLATVISGVIFTRASKRN